MAPSRAVVWPIFHTCTILAVAATVCWIYIFMDGLGWSGVSQFNWHPLCMVIAFVYFSANATVVYRLVELPKTMQKTIHGVLQFCAIGFIIFGLIAVICFKVEMGHNNFYSMHSWFGALTIVAFIAQLVLSIVIFQDIDPDLLVDKRREYKRLHIWLGVFILTLAFCTIETGINGLAILRYIPGFLDYDGYTPEAILLNSLALLVMFILFLAVLVWYTIPKVTITDYDVISNPGEIDDTHLHRPMAC